MRPEDESGDGQLTRLANANSVVAAAPDLMDALQYAVGKVRNSQACLSLPQRWQRPQGITLRFTGLRGFCAGPVE